MVLSPSARSPANSPNHTPPSSRLTIPRAQTPQQRLANERFAKAEAAKRGKSGPVVKKQEVQKAPISKGWVLVLAFVVCGGLIFELLRLFF
ncbi:hypothetical protein IWX90DRAFT_483744 [Phyllosticta citrichinensis]|uniref:Stress-associated endoplasmic reticulum protein n=1 Tax=Phyllosticta citrichinensis TaxID=1130410 RepID=A0ABR1Y3U3_9PEZI